MKRNLLSMSTELKILSFLFPLVMVGFMVYGQSVDYVLEGYVEGENTGMVKLVYNDNIKGININDSAKIHNGHFEIKGKLAHKFPYLTYLWLNDSLVTKLFFIASGYQVMHLDVNHFWTVPKLETKVAGENDRYNILIRPIDSLIRLFFIRRSRLYALYNNKLSQAVVDSLRDAKNDISDLKDKVLKSFLKTNPKSYVGLWYLLDRVLLMGYRPELYEAYEEVDDSLKQSIVGVRIKDILENSRKIDRGHVFPNFIVQTFSGDSVLFKIDGKQKFTLIDFWYSHCSPCIAQFNDLKKLYNKYHRLGFTILGISIDDRKQFSLWHNTIRKYKLPWPQFLDGGGSQSLKYGINSFPYNFIVNDSGVIQDSRLDMAQLTLFLKNQFEH